jgi:DNA polymerase-1
MDGVDIKELNKLFDTDVLSFDIEGTGVHARSDVPIGFSIAGSADKAFYVPIQDSYYRQLLANDNTMYIAHNAKYDRLMAKKAGVTVNNLCDPMIAAHLCEEPELSLSALILSKTGRYVKEFTELQNNLMAMSYDDVLAYTGPHARAAWILWYGYEDKDYKWRGYEYELRSKLLWDVFWNVEMPLVPVLSDMELNGAAVERGYLSELGKYFDERIELLEDALDYWAEKYAGKKINFNSADQVADLFFSKLKIKPSWKRTDSGRPSVEGKYLETIKDSHPILPWYLQYKQLQKLKGTYVNGLLRDTVDGRVYGSFNQAVTRTGRLSSSGPALQNIPQRTELGRRIRQAFVAPEGTTLVKSDADQVELKVMAVQSRDKAMLDAFRQKKDIHMETAIRIYHDEKRRADGKTRNFQMIYGGGNQRNREEFFQAYPGVLKWTNSVTPVARELGYVRTMFGRVRTIPELKSDNEKMAMHGDREGMSTRIQGTTAELVKIGMRRVWEDIQNTDIKMTLQVHDEVVYQVPDELVDDFAHHVGKRMQYDELDIPITYSVSIGKNWAHMEEVVKGGEWIKKEP